jgi:hypothetical protein
VWIIALESLDFYEYRELVPDVVAREFSPPISKATVHRSLQRLVDADISSVQRTTGRTGSWQYRIPLARIYPRAEIPQMQLCLRFKSIVVEFRPFAGPRHRARRHNSIPGTRLSRGTLHAERRFFVSGSSMARTTQQQLDDLDGLIAKIEAAGENASIAVLGRVFTKRNLDELYRERAPDAARRARSAGGMDVKRIYPL